jgi:predicted phosphoserine aminotransferase
MPKLFIPGPVDVREEILEAMGTAPVGHRTKDFEAIYARVQEKLQKILFTKDPVFMCTNSATGVWEAVARNCTSKKALVASCGAFSDRWFDVFGWNGKAADQIKVDWGQAVSVEKIADALKAGDYDCFAMVHNETSTGVMHDLEAVAAVMKDYPDVIWALDAVSSLSGVKIDIEGLGLDVVLASVQKCFGLPPGFALAAVSQKALEKSKTVENRGLYFDFQAMLKYHAKNQTFSTPSTSHLFALDTQLEAIMAEGLDQRFARHKEMAAFVQKWIAEGGLAVFPQEGYWSDTLTVVRNTKGIDIPELNKFLLAEKDAILANGYGKLKGETFRIPHMADLTMDDMKNITAWIEEGARKQGKW